MRFLLLLCLAAPLGSAAEQQTRFVITRPTLISFVLDFTDKQTETEGNEALADFEFYLPGAEDALQKAGVEVHQVFHVKSFQVKSGSRWRTFAPRKVTIGYYFIAPGREPRIEYGVEDTETILDIARRYFPTKFPITPHGAGIATAATEQRTRFEITRPTLISFFLDFTDELSLPDAEEALQKAGVEVHQVFQVKSIQVKSGSRWRTFTPRTGSAGYYFIAPGREPRIEYGVDDTDTILGLAGEYFHLQLLRDDFLISSRGAGNVTLDMSQDEVRRLFPDSEFSADGNEIRIRAPQSGEVAIRISLNSKTSRAVEMDIFDSRYRTDRYTNLGPGSTFGELLHKEAGLSLVQVSDTWAVASSNCMTFQLDVDDTTRSRLGTEERAQWPFVIPESTPIRAVTLFASGCRM